jgi:hypothetical protein
MLEQLNFSFTRNGVAVNLIYPMIWNDQLGSDGIRGGYYYLDLSNDLVPNAADRLTHDTLDLIFNNGTDTSVSASTRQFTLDGYLFTLPTSAEIKADFSSYVYPNTAGYFPDEFGAIYDIVPAWGSASTRSFWTADNPSFGNHNFYNHWASQQIGTDSDTSSRWALIRVEYLANDAPTGTVTITGTPTQGQVLTASNTLDDIDGLGTITYQWKADGTNIADATSSTYTLTQAQVGKAITVLASYTDLLGAAESKVSSATTAVANINDLPTGSVSIAGTPTQGQTLTVSNTLVDVDGLGTITYQWRADGANISGAGSSTLTLTQAQVGKAISVAASYTDLLGTAENVISNPTSVVAGLVATPTFAATYQIPVSAIQSIGLSPDGQFLLIKTSTDLQIVAIGSSMSFNGSTVSTSDLTQSMAPIPVFKSSGGVGGFTLPELYTGPASLGLKYQLIETADNAVVIGSSDNDFIKVSSANSIGKAVNGGGGNDVIDGGVGSTFVTGGGTTANSSTYFLDGRAPGTSWSTITDFKLDIDKATIWGFVKGVSSVDASFTNFNGAGAAGYEGLTLHFKNLLPSGQTSGTNANLNSITLTGRTLQEFGASSLAELNTQINNQTNPNFLVGATQDSAGTHGYLFIS